MVSIFLFGFANVINLVMIGWFFFSFGNTKKKEEKNWKNLLNVCSKSAIVCEENIIKTKLKKYLKINNLRRLKIINKTWIHNNTLTVCWIMTFTKHKLFTTHF